MRVDRDGGDVLMVAGSTGLAPLRALIMDLSRYGVNPRVHLFFGARYRCELYDLRTLWEIASHNPWLSVSPVAEYTPGSVLGGRLPRRFTTAWPARHPKPASCPRWSPNMVAGATGRS